MKLIDVYDLVMQEIEKKFSTKVECAKDMGMSRQGLNHLLNGLKNGNEISFNRLIKVLNFFGYEIEIKKRG